MADSDAPRPDFREGITITTLPDGDMLLGRAGGEDLLLARAGDSVFAVGAYRTHYHGPLADGLVVGDDPKRRRTRSFDRPSEAPA